MSGEQLEWAGVIFVMERVHRIRLSQPFQRRLKRRRLTCLDIPDDYECMQPELVKVIQAKAGPFLTRT